jgi:hypothetical protein
MKPRLIKDISTYSIFLITILLLISTGKWEIKWWYFFPIFLIIKFIVSIVYTGIWGISISDLVLQFESNEKQTYLLYFQYRIFNHYTAIVEVPKIVNINESDCRRVIHNQISMEMIAKTIYFGITTKKNCKISNLNIPLTFHSTQK